MAALFWNEDRPPTMAEYPKVLLRSVGAGAFLGLAASCLLNLLFNRGAFREWPKLFFYSAYMGAVFGTSFFVCCGLSWSYLRPLLKGYSATSRGVLTAVIGAAGAMLAFSIATALILWIPDLHFWGRENFNKMLGIEAVIGAVMALVIGTYKTMQRQIRNAEAVLHENKLREHTLSEAAARAQALALQAQINPHFFFNTLNTLSAIIPINPTAAQEMVGRLADMFRYTLACSRDGQVTLTEELAFIENYLKLEKARFSDRLRITLPQGQFNDIQLPGLSLQPLVENAIKHGIAKRIEGGEVNVSVHRNGNLCFVEVVNPAEISAKSAEFFREGHALSIVRQRMALRSGSVEVQADQPGTVRVSLMVPGMIRALIVDDEAPARAHLARLLEAESSVQLVGSAANGPEALEMVEDLNPDVVFLDIEMPAMNGFEVLRNMNNAPLVVFATAFDEFAVKAFESNALDYILKPVQPQRVKQTVQRIHALLHSGRSEYRDSMRDVLSLMEKERGAAPTKLAARRGKRFILLALNEVLHITIEDKLVFAHTAKERFLVEKTVSEMEQMLADAGFRRISRGTLVNMEHVRELAPWFSGTWKLKLSTGAELDVSRDRARAITDAMGI